MGDAATTLRAAQLFLALAQEQPNNRREEMVALLEATIVFGRSVTLLLQKEYAHKPGFKEWYERERAKLQEDAFSRFIIDRRDFILHEGHLRVRQDFRVSITEVVGLGRTPPRAVGPVESSSASIESSSVTGYTLRDISFGDSPFERDSAWQLMKDYLARLQGVVAEADQKFGAS